MRNEIRVLEIVKSLDIGGIGGGAERFGVDLSVALTNKGVPVTVCVYYRTFTEIEVRWLERLKQDNIEVLFLSSWGRDVSTKELKELLKGAVRLMRYQSRFRFNIIHSHAHYGTLAGIYVRLFSRAKDIVLIRTAHVTQEFGGSLYSKLKKLIWGEIIYPLSLDTQVAVSHAVRRRLEKYLVQRIIRKPVRVIYNSIPFPQQLPETRNFDKAPSEKFIIGTAARLEEQKGLAYLIEAASLVCKQYPNVRFLIAGEGELRSLLQDKIVQLDLSRHVYLLGKHPNIYEFLGQLDLFVLPSLWEGLPTVILEAMFAGVPLIATNIPGTDELIEDGVNGWLVSPQNPIQLAEKIIEAIRSPHLRKRFVEAGREKVMNFSMDKIANQYLDLFYELIDLKFKAQ